jgi:hypothetical protein
MASSAAAAAKAAAKAKAAAQKAMKELISSNSSKWFAIAMGGLMVLFIFFHWSRYVCTRYFPKNKSAATRIPTSMTRYVPIPKEKTISPLTPDLVPLEVLCLEKFLASHPLGIYWYSSSILQSRLRWASISSTGLL